MVKIERPRVFRTETPNEWGEGGSRFWIQDTPIETQQDALLISILKWHILCWFYRNGMFPDFGAVSTCGMCQFRGAFYYNCRGCLIAEETDYPLCGNTPLEDFEEYLDGGDSQMFLRYAQEELRFLKQLYHKHYDRKKGKFPKEEQVDTDLTG